MDGTVRNARIVGVDLVVVPEGEGKVIELRVAFAAIVGGGESVVRLHLHANLTSVMHLIDTIGVGSLAALPQQPCRIKLTTNSQVLAVGHYMKGLWWNVPQPVPVATNQPKAALDEDGREVYGDDRDADEDEGED